MSDLNSFISTYHWQLFEEADNPHQASALSPLIYQDSFIRYLPEINETAPQAQAILHLYPLLKPAVLLGPKDSRLPKLRSANQFLSDSGYEIVLRPHGGLAVVNDPGIINLALVTDKRYYELSIDQAYEEMVLYLREVFGLYGLKLESYEIPDSYCPGKYDLVIGGLKVGGIAQRRFKDGITTAAYISVNGKQYERGKLIQAYYRIGEADESYPLVNPLSMTTLEAAYQDKVSLADFRQKLISVIEKHSRLTEGNYQDPVLEAYYQKAVVQAEKRNQQLFS